MAMRRSAGTFRRGIGVSPRTQRAVEVSPSTVSCSASFERLYADEDEDSRESEIEVARRGVRRRQGARMIRDLLSDRPD